MPDGTTRFSYRGEPIFHYMGCSTFSNFTVLPEIAVTKIRADAPFNSACYVGCGVTNRGFDPMHAGESIRSVVVY